MSFGVKFNTGTGSDNVLITNDDTPPGLFHSFHSVTITSGQTSATINLTNVTRPLNVVAIWNSVANVLSSPTVSISYNYPNQTAVASISFSFTYFAGGKVAYFYFLEA